MIVKDKRISWAYLGWRTGMIANNVDLELAVREENNEEDEEQNAWRVWQPVVSII